MAPSFFSKLAFSGLAAASVANAYKLTAHKGPNCGGGVQQVIDDTKFGAFCHYFDDGAASVSVSGGGDDYQWIFFNQYPCDENSMVGSFLGNKCITQGGTKIKSVTNILVEGTKKRDVPETLQPESIQKRERAGIIRTWKDGDCSGAPTNELAFINENLPVSVNSVGSARVSMIKDGDTAFACTDSDCHVDAQVAVLMNDQCVDLRGKNVESAMVIGVPTPAKRDFLVEAHAHKIMRRDDNISCGGNLANYKDALRVGDKWQGDNGVACCCHVPGGPNSMTVGSASASISDNIRCPADPSGQPPPPSTCPLNCNEMRSYVYAIATKCKTGDMTGGTANLPADQKISVYHS